MHCFVGMAEGLRCNDDKFPLDVKFTWMKEVASGAVILELEKLWKLLWHSSEILIIGMK